MRFGSSVATKGRDKLSEAAGYLSKYVSKERAADWLREKAGQRVFYVAPWLSRTAGASMRIARLGRRLWAAKHGYCETPRCGEERGGRALDPAGSSRPRALGLRVHETVERIFARWLTRLSPVPSTRTQKGVVGSVKLATKGARFRVRPDHA